MRCLKAIKEYAFTASPYPVIITLEDHLTPDLQAKVAQMVTETFGSMLFFPESEKLKELLTPESLKYRILISTKPPKEYLTAEDDKQSRSRKCQVSDDDGVCYMLQSENDIEGKTSPSSPVYKQLIAIHAGKPKGGLKHALKVENDEVRRLSLVEQALEKAVENHGHDVVRYKLYKV